MTMIQSYLRFSVISNAVWLKELRTRTCSLWLAEYDFSMSGQLTARHTRDDKDQEPWTILRMRTWTYVLSEGKSVAN
jgi:hypothetical protein